MIDETLGMSNFTNNVDIVSALEKIGISCKDSNGNWENIEDILQEIAKQWKNKEE